MKCNESALSFVPYSQSRASFYRKKGYWIGETFIDFLKNCCNKYGDNIALIHQNRKLTYKQLFTHG